MSIEVTKNGNTVKIELTLTLNGTSMLDMETEIQREVNEVGMAATGFALSRFETTGEPIKIGSVKMTTQGRYRKDYETPYGRVSLARYVYQTSAGGKTYCPLDDRARIIVNSTPKFAKMVSYKYASLRAKDVSEDMRENHGRHIARGTVQNIADAVGAIAQATEEAWEYEIPEQEEPVASVSISLDGTCVLMKQEGYREAMTGNVSLYNKEGERLHTIYIGAAPEYGKETFLKRLQQEVDKIKEKYPDAQYIGIADGAPSNWGFLEPNTKHHILDFYYAAEYLSAASEAFGKTGVEHKKWLEDACHRLKHDNQAALSLLNEMREKKKELDGQKRIAKVLKEKLNKAITYFQNQLPRMDYAHYQELKFPIGSGVTEAACKTLIKARLCRSAMQWRDAGAKIVIALRSLVQTSGRWNQFWNKFNIQGLSCLDLA